MNYKIKTRTIKNHENIKKFYSRNSGQDSRITIFNNPPIPIRYMDWVAYRDGDEEDGLYGYGCTEAEAIRALLDKEEDDDE